VADYTVAISSDFFSAFAALPKAKQGRVMDFMSKFRSNPMSPGMNYEKINDAADKNLRSVRVDDTYRAIVMRGEGSNVFLLLWVDHHDKAYEWAVKKRCILNRSTGSIQIYEAQTAETAEKAEWEGEDRHAMFEMATDDQLRALGIPEDLYIFVRSICSEQDFSAAQSKLPVDAYEALGLVRDGYDINEVVEILYGESHTLESDDLSSALENPITQMQFTIVEGEEELISMMNAPLEKWRVFLHPSQRRLVNRDYSGSARVLGGAGTGKTVVAMHRARYLAQQCRENERVLFTTFTANLAQDIKDNLRKICTTDEMRKVEVIHLDSWISRFLQQQDYSYTIQYGDVIKELWKQATLATGDDLDYPEGFFEDEWGSVVQAQGISTLQEYVQAPRSGRGVRLDRQKRIAVWKVFDEYRTLMNKKKVRDPDTAMSECCQLLKARPDYHPYRSIVVDESQDFGMGAFRLLRTLAGVEHPNDLFIVGDAHQRIYRNRVTLSKCGISVRGRSSRLRVNYRTTEEIRDWAMNVLKGMTFDDLDGGKDTAKGYRSLSHGDVPTVNVYNTFAEETVDLIRLIQEKFDSGLEPMEICVVTRTNKLLADYAAALMNAGLRIYEIKRSKIDDRNMPGIRLATMHRVKGLEFTCVFIVGMMKNVMPLKAAIETTDSVSKAEAIMGERCLLYVALTRAKKAVFISAYGHASEFIKI